MSKYFDFSPVKPWAGGYGDSLDALGDAFVSNRKERLDKQRADAYAAQVKATEENQRRKQAQDDIAFEQGQSDRRVKLAENISNMLGSGRLNEAQAMAGASQFQNPRTGNMAGVTLTADQQGPAPVAPEAPGPAPVAPEAPVFPSQNESDYYKIMKPDAARAEAMHRALGGATQPPAMGSAQELLATAAGEGAAGFAERAQDERGRYASDSLAHDVSQSAYDSQKKDYDVANAAYTDRQQHPTFTMGMPGGQSVKIDPREAKLAKEDEARQTAAMLRKQSASPGLPPHVAEQMLLSANAIEAQLPAAAAGAINNARSQTQAEDTKTTLQGKQITSNEKIASGHDRARVASAAKREGQGTSPTYLGGVAELVKMQQAAMDPNGNITDPEVNGNIAARAAELGIPAGGKNGYLNAVREVTRGNAVASRTGRANSALEATDADGNVVGGYKNTTEARAGNKFELAYSRVRERVQALINDVKAYGPRVTDPAAIQRRQSLAIAAQAALRPYNDLGGTDASQRLEHELQGASGTPESLGNFLMGANIETYGRILDEAHGYHAAGQKVRLRAGSGPGAAAKKPNKAQGIAAGATGQKPAEGRHIKLKNGETGVLAPDGTFHPDGPNASP